jgi:FkbM family methyltransferase
MSSDPSLKSFAQNREDIIAWDYFDRKTDGFFVEVGANHPTDLSQTWFLEQQGWKGILVEPLPACCEKLRAVRKNSTICEAAAGAPEQVGEATLNVAASDVWSHLGEEDKTLPVTSRIKVAVRTLESILDEHKVSRIDLLSIDTEGMELNVLRGLNLAKRRPALVLLEDHMETLDLFFYMRQQGYRLIHRTGPNNWWVPTGMKTIPTTLSERLSLWNRVWFRYPRRRLKWLLGLGPKV